MKCCVTLKKALCGEEAATETNGLFGRDGRAFIRPVQNQGSACEGASAQRRALALVCVGGGGVGGGEVFSARGRNYRVSYKRCYIMAADGRGGPGIKEPLSTPLL